MVRESILTSSVTEPVAHHQKNQHRMYMDVAYKYAYMLRTVAWYTSFRTWPSHFAAACLRQMSRYTRQAHNAKHPPPLVGVLHCIFGFRHGRVAMKSCCKSIQRRRHICMPAGLSASRPKDLVIRKILPYRYSAGYRTPQLQAGHRPHFGESYGRVMRLSGRLRCGG